MDKVKLGSHGWPPIEDGKQIRIHKIEKTEGGVRVYISIFPDEKDDDGFWYAAGDCISIER